VTTFKAILCKLKYGQPGAHLARNPDKLK